MTATASTSFYITGGTVPRDAACYVARQADLDLLEGLRKGQFCYVLTPRQMGKSSLMVRAATTLRQEGVTCVILVGEGDRRDRSGTSSQDLGILA